MNQASTAGQLAAGDMFTIPAADGRPAVEDQAVSVEPATRAPGIPSAGVAVHCTSGTLLILPPWLPIIRHP